MNETEATKIVDCLTSDGKISSVALRNYIQSALERNMFDLDGVCPKRSFADAGDFVMKDFEDSFFDTYDTYEYILENEDLSPKGRSVIEGAMSALGGAYLRARNLTEISRGGSIDDTELVPIDLTEYAAQFAEYLRSVVSAEVGKGIRLVRGARKSLMCAAESTMLTLILINFVHNALKHSRSEDGRIDIAVSRLGKYNRAALSVIDYGIGVDIKKLRGMMERNTVRAENGSMKLRKYRGCGLIACQRMAEALGGNIMVGNVAGGGAIFTLVMPDPGEIKNRVSVSVSDLSGAAGPDKRLIKIVLLKFIRHEK